MQSLTIDPPVPFLVPQQSRITVALIGCGGTGSHLAQALARLAAHCRDTGGPTLDLTFIDPDVVEPKNIGRQLFAPADLGRNKAEVLAQRFSAVWGLRITAIPHVFTGVTGDLYNPGYGILVGCVDSTAGRQAMSRVLGSGGWRIWLDCGNEDLAGQVVVGTTKDKCRLAGALTLGGVCTDLPAPSLVYPNLLEEAVRAPRADCAAAMEDNRQSLLVNSAVATIAAQYLYQIIVARRLTTFETVLDLETLSMRSTPITARTLAPYQDADAAPLPLPHPLDLEYDAELLDGEEEPEDMYA